MQYLYIFLHSNNVRPIIIIAAAVATIFMFYLIIINTYAFKYILKSFKYSHIPIIYPEYKIITRRYVKFFFKFPKKYMINIDPSLDYK